MWTSSRQQWGPRPLRTQGRSGVQAAPQQSDSVPETPSGSREAGGRAEPGPQTLRLDGGIPRRPPPLTASKPGVARFPHLQNGDTLSPPHGVAVQIKLIDHGKETQCFARYPALPPRTQFCSTGRTKGGESLLFPALLPWGKHFLFHHGKGKRLLAGSHSWLEMPLKFFISFCSFHIHQTTFPKVLTRSEYIFPV